MTLDPWTFRYDPAPGGAQDRAIAMNAFPDLPDEEAWFVIDADGVIVDWPRSAARLLRHAVSDIVGRSIASLYFDEDIARDKPRQHVARAVAAGRHVGTGWFRRADGSPLWASLLLLPLRDETAHVAAIRCVMRDLEGSGGRDLPDRRGLEALLHEARNRALVAQAGCSMAHDFNNVLTVICGCAEILQRQIPIGTPPHALVDEIRSSSNRAASLTRELLALGRLDRSGPVVVNAAQLPRQLAPALRRMLGDEIDLTVLAPREPAWIRIEPDRLEQALLNIAVNSRDAMPNGGTLALTVTLQPADDAAGDSFFKSELVRLSVSDTGPGMTPATCGRVLERGFTTRPGRFGLGLWVVDWIARAANGRVLVSSEPGRGTSVDVLLPRVNEPAPELDGPP